MAKKKTVYPDILYLVKEYGHDEEYFVAHESPVAVAIAGDTVEVALYKFDRMVKINAKVLVE